MTSPALRVVEVVSANITLDESAVGSMVGEVVGCIDGTRVTPCSKGECVGDIDGKSVGSQVGSRVGETDGTGLVCAVGSILGRFVGLAVG